METTTHTAQPMASNDMILWGSHPAYVNGTPIKLTGGNLKHCRSAQRQRETDGGWLLAIYRKGTYPAGLIAGTYPERLLALAAR